MSVFEIKVADGHQLHRMKKVILVQVIVKMNMYRIIIKGRVDVRLLQLHQRKKQIKQKIVVENISQVMTVNQMKIKNGEC